MVSSHDDSSSDERGNNNKNNNGHKKYHRHTPFQIQRLESYFKESPHPDDVQRRQLSGELNMDPQQIKFWFQNKRTQIKTQTEKADNNSLRAENIKMKRENELIEEALRTVLCPPCGGPCPGHDERERSLRKLRLDNVILKQEFEKRSSYLRKNGGHSTARVESLTSSHGPSSYASTSNNRPAMYGSTSNHRLERPSLLRGPNPLENINLAQPPQRRKPVTQQHFPPLTQMEKIVMAEVAAKAVVEVMRLVNMEEHVWIKSSIDNRLIIDQDNYKQMFPNVTHYSSLNPQTESSRDVVVVPMDARNLVDMFLDMEKYKRLFPTIVNESAAIHVLESMDRERPDFSKLIYEQLHILSPLVLPREFMILRCCKQMEEDLWVVADVSYNLQYVDFEFKSPICFKRPSGCIIQALPNGFSKVTWVEHVEVNEKMRPHRLYRDILGGASGYGARRWTVALERMCERLSLSTVSVFPTTDYGGVVQTIEGRRSLMKLGERMLKNFAWTLKMSDKCDFSQVSEANNSGVRLSVRTNREAGQPPGLIVCAGSSLYLPLPPIQVYSFLRNIELRHQWDVLCHGNPAAEIARFATGSDPNNSVNILQPISATETSELVIIQDGYIDALGGMVVYAPVGLATAYSAITGQSDSSGVPILPSGFIISRDGRPTNGDQENYCTTVLTVAFQILVSGPSYSKDIHLVESAATVNTLISSTVQRVKAMLNCEDGR
ncbi:unnamed protein product [Cochlearia groenlandica]